MTTTEPTTRGPLGEGTDLRHREFADLDLTRADLTVYDLTGAAFRRCNLTGARITTASCVRFVDCNLDRLDAADAYLYGVRVLGGTARHAYLASANAANLIMSGTDADGLIARGARFTHASMRDTVLTDADLTDAVLTDADLTGTDLTRANLTRAVVRDAVFTDVTIDRARVEDVQYLAAVGLDDIIGDTIDADDADTYGARVSCGDCGVRIDEDTTYYSDLNGLVCDECHYAEDEGYDDDAGDDGYLIGYSHKPAPRYHRATGEDTAHDSTTFLGVEVECYAGPAGIYAALGLLTPEQVDHLNAYGRVIDADLAAAGPLYAKSDSSLESGGLEVVSHPHTLAAWREALGDGGYLAARWHAFREAGGHGWTRASAGTHVHVSRHAFPTAARLTVAIELIRRNAAAWHAIAGRGDNGYTRADFHGRTGVRIARPWARGYTGAYDRYDALNTTPARTVELRIFRTSTRPERILGAVEVAHALTTYAALIDDGTAPRLARARHLIGPDAMTRFREHVAEHYPAAAALIDTRLGTTGDAE